jgi:DNA-binding MarR family transcriptional regulator
VADAHERLGWLLKHAQVRLSALTADALEPYGVSGRELAVLSVLAAVRPLSQQEAAAELRIDRTTMVAFVDQLAAKGLVERRPDAADRRRNLVELTAAGRTVHDGAGAAYAEAERRFLAPLSAPAAARLRTDLASLITEE